MRKPKKKRPVKPSPEVERISTEIREMGRNEYQKKKPAPEVVSLMEKIKGQLRSMKLVRRFKKATRSRIAQHYFPTVEEYQSLDPYWQSTMGGAFAGRVVRKSFAVDFPKTFCIMELIKQDLRKWPWKKRSAS